MPDHWNHVTNVLVPKPTRCSGHRLHTTFATLDAARYTKNHRSELMLHKHQHIFAVRMHQCKTALSSLLFEQNYVL